MRTRKHSKTNSDVFSIWLNLGANGTGCDQNCYIDRFQHEHLKTLKGLAKTSKSCFVRNPLEHLLQIQIVASLSYLLSNYSCPRSSPCLHVLPPSCIHLFLPISFPYFPPFLHPFLFPSLSDLSLLPSQGTGTDSTRSKDVYYTS